MATDPPPSFGEKLKSCAPKVIQAALTCTLVVFWSLLVSLNLLFQRFFHRKQICHREIHQRPAVLDEGWNHKFVQLTNLRLHYVQSGSDDKPLMVLIHGFPEFWYSWRYQLKHFADRYRVVAIDQRGYGESDRPASVSDYNVHLLAADVEQLIHKLGYKKAVVAGHDWGAVVAWRVALSYPELVEKLVILNVPHPAAFKQVLRTNVKQLLNSWYMFMFQVPLLPEFTIAADDYDMIGKMFRGHKGGLRLNRDNFSDEDLEAWKYVFSQQGALTGPLNYYRSAVRQPVETTMDDIVKPETLIVWGTEDAFLVKEGAELSVSACENARLAYVEGASHWVQQDNPEEVNKLIDEFLRN